MSNVSVKLLVISDDDVMMTSVEGAEVELASSLVLSKSKPGDKHTDITVKDNFKDNLGRENPSLNYQLHNQITYVTKYITFQNIEKLHTVFKQVK